MHVCGACVWAVAPGGIHPIRFFHLGSLAIVCRRIASDRLHFEVTTEAEAVAEAAAGAAAHPTVTEILLPRRGKSVAEVTHQGAEDDDIVGFLFGCVEGCVERAGTGWGMAWGHGVVRGPNL